MEGIYKEYLPVKPNPKYRWWNLEPKMLCAWVSFKVGQDGFIRMVIDE